MVLQNPQEQADRLPPPRTLILDFTLTHTRYGRSHVHTIGQMTNTRRSDGVPEPDGALLAQARAKIIHYRQVYLSRTCHFDLYWCFPVRPLPWLSRVGYQFLWSEKTSRYHGMTCFYP